MATFKEKIESVIDELGEPATITPVTTQTYDEDTGWSDTLGAPVDINIIPYNYLTGNYNQEEFAKIRTGNSDVIIKGDVTASTGDILTLSGKTYVITSVEPYRLSGESLAQDIKITEQLS